MIKKQTFSKFLFLDRLMVFYSPDIIFLPQKIKKDKYE